jgi:hypothetical protein
VGKAYEPKKHPLPSPKFTVTERDAWDWLHDCDIRPWLVDLVTKEVNTPQGKFKNLVEYAVSKGWDQDGA